MTYKLLEGQYPGMYAYQEYSEKANGIIFVPCPQIGFLKHSGEYEWYLLENRPNRDGLSPDEYQLKVPNFCIVIGCDDAEKTLNAYGMKRSNSFKVSDNFDGGVLCEVKEEIDETIFRTVAKIGFNYLTYWQGAAFALQDSFDPIRRYVRWGEIPETPLRGVNNERFFPDEKHNGKKRLGHIIAVYWEEKEVVATHYMIDLNYR